MEVNLTEGQGRSGQQKGSSDRSRPGRADRGATGLTAERVQSASPQADRASNRDRPCVQEGAGRTVGGSDRSGVGAIEGVPNCRTGAGVGTQGQGERGAQRDDA